MRVHSLTRDYRRCQLRGSPAIITHDWAYFDHKGQAARPKVASFDGLFCFFFHHLARSCETCCSQNAAASPQPPRRCASCHGVSPSAPSMEQCATRQQQRRDNHKARQRRGKEYDKQKQRKNTQQLSRHDFVTNHQSSQVPALVWSSTGPCHELGKPKLFLPC